MKKKQILVVLIIVSVLLGVIQAFNPLILAESNGYHEIPLSPYYPISHKQWWLYQFDGYPDFTNTNCGPACAAMVINYLKGKGLTTKYGSFDVNAIPNVHCTARGYYCQTYLKTMGYPEIVYQKGFYDSDWSLPGAEPLQIQNALFIEGISSHIIKGGDYGDPGSYLQALEDAIRQGKLCIAVVNPTKYIPETTVTSHWTVIYAYDDEFVYLNDPGWIRFKDVYPISKSNFREALWDVPTPDFWRLTIIVDTTLLINNAIQRGLQWLQIIQNPDGSWTYSGRVIEENVGLTSIAITAFLGYGISEDYPTVRNALNWILSKQRADGCITNGWYEVYDTSLAILALTATRNKEYYDEIRSATEFLVGIQNSEATGYLESDIYYGGWSYWKGLAGWADLSNTQFAMLALWYAEEFNPGDTIVPAGVWSKAEIFVTRCQNRKASNPDYSFYDDGGFIYQPRSTIWAGGLSYGSMTAAGLWGLFACGVSRNDGRVRDALGWFQNNYYIDQNYPIGRKFLYYYLYGLAKACMLWNINSIAGHNWYEEMSEFLINNQQPDGHWLGTDPYEEPDLVATCWALLALETKTTALGTRLRFKVDSPVDLHVYDPLDRHVGINYTTGEVEVEIPGANYSGPETEPQIIEVHDPMAGGYRVKLVGRERGTYILTIEGLVGNETVYTRSFEGAIGIREEKELNAIISGIAGPLTIDIPDTIPPDAITDLRIIDATLDSITLAWTSPGDDWGTGTASQYDIRYSTEPITEDNWDEAIQCEGEPTPHLVGSVETFTITNLARGTTYYFAIKSADEIPNWSNISNVAKAFTWSYIFEDTYGRNTTLKININEKAFQFLAPHKDYGIRNATRMTTHRRTISIWHKDDELTLVTIALDTELDFCVAIAWDRQTNTRYFLIDKVGIEN